MTLEAYLLEDHRRLDALLRAAIAEERFDLDAFESFRAGLLRHIGIEEKLLVPWARGKKLPVPADLRVQHAAIASLLVPTPDHALGRELAALLEQHNRLEEGPGALYAQCAALGADELLPRAQAAPVPPLALHFDGAGTYRTAAEALAAAERVRR
jgi:hypothetical protein